jgi:galactokinase
VAALRDIAPEKMDAFLAQIADVVVRRRARHVISEQSRVLEVVGLLESGRLAEVGPVLSAGHWSLRDDFEVSCAELDTIVEVAVASGACGARCCSSSHDGRGKGLRHPGLRHSGDNRNRRLRRGVASRLNAV